MNNHQDDLLMVWRERGEAGVALILVMLAMLVLSVLAATIVFTARSETLSSVNYKLDTQADYLAKAGLQLAINWFRSSDYTAVSPSQALTYYSLTDPGAPYHLFTANNSPVQCLGGVANSGCGLLGGPVALAPSTSNSMYPFSGNGALPNITGNFSTDLSGRTLTGDAENFGTVTISASLLNYQIINMQTSTGLKRMPMETWLVSSIAKWNGLATAEERAVIQPVFAPTWSNAIFGLCSVTEGSSGRGCTDSYSSGVGGPNIAMGCNNSPTNAGVGSLGSVTVGGGTTGGNVTIATGTLPSGCAATPGCTNCTPGTNPSGNLITGVPAPPLPPLPAIPDLTNASAATSGTFPSGALFPATLPAIFPYGNGTYNSGAGDYDPSPPFNANPTNWSQPCGSGAPTPTTCDGTWAHPYLIKQITGNSSFIGSTDLSNPVVYDIGCMGSNNVLIQVSGAVVFNLSGQNCGGSAISFAGSPGNGIVGGQLSSTPNIPPAYIQINVNPFTPTTGVSITGNGNTAIVGILNAPYSDMTINGGGNAGKLVGSMVVRSFTDHGGFPVHYDTSLSRVSGLLGTTTVVAYSRQKQ